MDNSEIKERLAHGRQMERLEGGIAAAKGVKTDDAFNLIDTLQGTWTSDGRGWNIIALPFKDTSAQFSYRVLMNQYGESLNFKFADKNIPNRGVTEDGAGTTDQIIDALDYEQTVIQVAGEDSPSSTLVSPDAKGIHHEPGLFLQIHNHRAQDAGEELEVARLATIPHGDSVLALGKVNATNGAPVIPDENALPVRVNQDVNNNPYLAPYKQFEDIPFFGTVPRSLENFPGFFASNANAILQFANPGDRVRRTTTLHFDTKFGSGGIVNIPFVVREANATEMKSTFWIMELEPTDESAAPEFIMQYSQTVFLDFFDSRDEPGKLIRWPHVSINTLRRA